MVGIDGNADGDTDLEITVGFFDGRNNLSAELFSHLDDSAVAGIVRQGNDKLIPSSATEYIRIPEALSECSGDGCQEPVAGVVAVSVVDRFEIVQVNEKNADLL